MLPIHRPVAVSMFFLGILLLGMVAWLKMPVELFPTLVGNRINVQFYRPGSEPEVIERDILLPLQAKVSAMSGVSETWGQVQGPSGNFTVRFDPGVNIKIRELELQRVVTEMQREQPRGAWMNVRAAGTGAISDLAMMIHILGADESDRDALYDLTEQIIAPRFAVISGVSQAQASGGARKQVNVTVDPMRATSIGLTLDSIVSMVQRAVGRMRYVGALEDESGRTAVVLDGRPIGVDALADSRVAWNSPGLLRHVGEVELGTGEEERLLRVNGRPAVGLVVFQEQGSNLVRLGRTLRERVEEVRNETAAQGLDLVINFDAAEAVEEQISRLSRLGASGFLIALVVLFFFLREWRAVAVVAIAVPVSLMAALSLLYISGQSLNLVSLFGLMMAIGLVVDNSVVVFEAISRGLERDQPIEAATREGLRRTVRAIAAASATTAVVFLPAAVVEMDDEMMRSLIAVVSLAILLPLLASLLVAVGLVPLLAHRLAAPAAARRLLENRRRRQLRGNLRKPDPARIIFTGIVAAALRQPATLLASTVGAILITVIIALPWVVSNSDASEATRPEQIQIAARFPSDRTIDIASDAIAHLERALTGHPAVETVEALIEPDGAGLTISFIDHDDLPADFEVQQIWSLVRKAAKSVQGLEILRPGDERRNGSAGGNQSPGEAFRGAPAEIILSGPDTRVLTDLASSVEAQLESLPQVEDAWTSVRPGMSEYWLSPVRSTFEALGLSFSQVTPILSLAGREGQRMDTGFVLDNGRELPLVVERRSAREENIGLQELGRLRVQTPSGVHPIDHLADIRKMPAPPVIAHHNGRRELTVRYRLRGDIPQTGPSRIAIEEQIAEAISAIPRPRGTAVETQEEDTTTSWARRVGFPALGLLFLVLAMTFESLTLPILVLLALPITLLGAVWALALSGTAFSMMAALGALVLVGLTVNPAILLVDRMQQLTREGGWKLGSAAYGAVRERTRPVLMTTATTIAGLWPLAITSGRENEIWPPFAIIVIGGLITSGLLTLLVMPVGYILLRRVDDIFSRVGPWLVLAWMLGTVLIMGTLILSDTVTSMLWQSVLTILTASALLAIVVMIFRPSDIPVPDTAGGPPSLVVRFLHKTYGMPGAIRRGLMAPSVFRSAVSARGGSTSLKEDARDSLIPLGLGITGGATLALMVQSAFWQVFFWLVASLMLGRLLIAVRRFRGDSAGRFEPAITLALPWLALAAFTSHEAIVPYVNGLVLPGVYFVCGIAALVLLLAQSLRRTAKQASVTNNSRRPAGRLTSIWRDWSIRLAGPDLPVRPIEALAGIHFNIDRGMIGILGPNGAGKTTLLRQLAGVMDPTRGTIRVGGVPMPKIQRHLAEWVGYLPQDAGMPGGMSPREYLSWYAALYNIPPAERQQRVDGLLTEVGLTDKVDERIASLSGGMRQRVAVARALLRLPPIIIVDEPTVGLDPRERIRFRNLLSRLARDRIVLMSTHVVEDVAVACDRVLVIARGHLVYDGETGALARVANGRVWELRSPPNEVSLPDGVIRSQETPAADGAVIHRLIHADKPATTATPLPATLEDGYMWLLSQTEAFA
jgi:multidrug efflux pump subunit AcrB/ABC-type multidrug transport system ATPase subunit